MWNKVLTAPFFCVHADVSHPADMKSRVADISQSPGYRIRTESEQVSLYSPEQSSLHESEGLLLPSPHLLSTSWVCYTSQPYQLFSILLSHKVAKSRRTYLCLVGGGCVCWATPLFPFRFILSGFLSGSGGNSHSSTQMNSHSDSGYQDANSGYLSGQNMSKAELRMQHSFPGAVVRNTRAEGQAAAQVLPMLYSCCWAHVFLGFFFWQSF